MGLRNTLVVFIFLLGIALSFACIRSYWVGNAFVWRAHGFPSYSVAIYNGNLDVMWTKKGESGSLETSQLSGRDMPRPSWANKSEARISLPGFTYYKGSDIQQGFGRRDSLASDMSYVEIVLTLWPLTVSCLLFPSWYFRSILSPNRSKRKNLCGACGYDLRASSDRCPECGLAITDRKKKGGQTSF